MMYRMAEEEEVASKDNLQTYLDFLKVVISDGIVSPEENAALSALRRKLGLSEDDHDMLMKQLGLGSAGGALASLNLVRNPRSRL